MDLRKTAEYLTATDFLKSGFEKEAKIKGQTDLLPLETDANRAVEIYARRLFTMAIYPFIVASRVTGIDSALKLFRKKYDVSGH